ncbi:MAG: enoyl-CoA hydratase/isomerase family protein, partial [Gemmatimonadetes bacterium]|nr:enoyl-CoA hydratase/isomerase family protein [Gemmatimonadota bacterium]
MSITYAKDDHNVVTLTLNRPDHSTNIIDSAFALSLAEAVDRLEAEEPLTGVIVTSAKKTFLAGADLESLAAIEDPAEARRIADPLKTELRKLETLGKPVVAAINGTALGGGLELALACHHRIVLDGPGIKLGLPEVTLGLIPGLGGIVRLPRMLGLQDAMPYLLEGKQVGPKVALEAGMVDDLAADGDELSAKAKAWIEGNPDASQPWDRKGFKIPGGGPNHPKVAQMLAAAPAMLRQKTRRNYPAPEAILSVAVEGAAVDIDTASA